MPEHSEETQGNGRYHEVVHKILWVLVCASFGFTLLAFGYTYRVSETSAKKAEFSMLREDLKEVKRDVKTLSQDIQGFILRERRR